MFTCVSQAARLACVLSLGTMLAGAQAQPAAVETKVLDSESVPAAPAARLPAAGHYRGEFCRAERRQAPPCEAVVVRVDRSGVIHARGGWTRTLRLRLGRDQRVLVEHVERGRPRARFLGEYLWSGPQRLSFGEMSTQGWTLTLIGQVDTVVAR